MSFKGYTQACPVRNAATLPGIPGAPPPRRSSDRPGELSSPTGPDQDRASGIGTGFGKVRAHPDALHAVFPLSEADEARPAVVQSERERRDHVECRLLRTTSSGPRYLMNLLNANRAPGVGKYSAAEVERHLAQLKAEGRAVYTKNMGWRAR